MDLPFLLSFLAEIERPYTLRAASSATIFRPGMIPHIGYRGVFSAPAGSVDVLRMVTHWQQGGAEGARKMREYFEACKKVRALAGPGRKAQ